MNFCFFTLAVHDCAALPVKHVCAILCILCTEGVRISIYFSRKFICRSFFAYIVSLSRTCFCVFVFSFRQCTRTSGSSVLMEGWHWEQSSILHSGSHLRVPATASRCEAVGFLRYIERVSPTRAAALVFACRRALNASLHALSRVEIERGVTYGVFRVLLGTGRALPSRKEVQALDSRSTVALSAFEVLATCVAVLCSSARICHSDRVAVFVRVDSVPLASSSLPLHHSLSVVFRLEGNIFQTELYAGALRQNSSNGPRIV